MRAQELGWPHRAVRGAGRDSRRLAPGRRRGEAARDAWETRLASSRRKRGEFERAIAGELPEAGFAALEPSARSMSRRRPKVATRKASREWRSSAINAVTDLTSAAPPTSPAPTIPSPRLSRVSAGDFGGRYVHYGVREHGMAAAMNGIALHGGFIPFGGTFLVFTDYARGACGCRR